MFKLPNTPDSSVADTYPSTQTDFLGKRTHTATAATSLKDLGIPRRRMPKLGKLQQLGFVRLWTDFWAMVIWRMSAFQELRRIHVECLPQTQSVDMRQVRLDSCDSNSKRHWLQVGLAVMRVRYTQRETQIPEAAAGHHIIPA